MNIKKYMPVFLTIILIVLFAFSANAQCAMCAATAEKSEYAVSLNKGILYLLGAPVVILGGVLLIWMKNKDKFKSEQ